jgi:DNA-binding transcriptional ArsR family regulator
MNMKTRTTEVKISHLFQTLGQPARLQILLAIGEGEACVCHLEAMLGLRQAYISQHLMVLRKAKILSTRRDGRFIFYRLRDLKTLELIQLAGEVTNSAVPAQSYVAETAKAANCVCPTCTPTP